MNEEVVKKLALAVEEGRYAVEYVKPAKLISKRTEEQHGLGRAQYIINDFDDDDFGGIIIRTMEDDSDLELFLSWRTGKWTVDGEHFPMRNIPQTLIAELAPLDKALTISISDRELWRKAIAKIQGPRFSNEDVVVFSLEFCGKVGELFPWPAEF